MQEPSYLKLYKEGTLQDRIDKAAALMKSCSVCPRECRVDRLSGELGFCRTGAKAKVASLHAHFGEEAPLVGNSGSGTIFFRSCNLLCTFCQNFDISHDAEGGEVEPALRKLAEAARANIGGQAVIPPELEAFPPENQIPNTVRYLARDVLGQSDLKNGFTAEYKDGDTEYKLFFILHDSVDEAQKSYESYKTFMTKYAKDLEDHSQDEVAWFSAKDPYYEKVVVMQAGKVMLGALGLQDAERVNDYLGKVQEKLAALGRI